MKLESPPRLFVLLCASCLMLGAALGALAHLVHPEEPHSPEQIQTYIQHTPGAHVLLLFAVLLVQLGVPALIAQLRPCRTASVLSLPLLFLGIGLTDMIHCPVEFGALPAIYKVTPQSAAAIYLAFGQTPFGTLQAVAGPLLMIGVLIFLIGTRGAMGAARLGRWLLLLSLVAMIATAAGVPYLGKAFAVLFYMAWFCYGLAMFSLPGGTADSVNAMRNRRESAAMS